MSNDNVKIYRNPGRKNVEEQKTYIPQYKLLGVDPEMHAVAKVPPKAPVSLGSTDNARLPKPPMRNNQPYAEAVHSPIGRGRGPLPNVGNNMEQTWSSVDDKIVDDVFTFDPNEKMIDNNDFVAESSFELHKDHGNKVSFDLPTNNESLAYNAIISENDGELSSIVKQLEEDDYLILVNGVSLCSGASSYIEEVTKSLLFGEHKLFDGPVPIEDLVILKKIKIKIGVFVG